jgi:hypothetical protein
MRPTKQEAITAANSLVSIRQLHLNHPRLNLPMTAREVSAIVTIVEYILTEETY